MTEFHLAFPVVDLESTQAFYEGKLGCEVGRRGKVSMVLRLGPAQIVAHAVGGAPSEQEGIYPRHFGLILESRADWEEWYARALEHDLEILDGPRIRYEGQVPEHHTFFLRDPSGNVLEFKYYSNPDAVYGAKEVQAAGDADDVS